MSGLALGPLVISADQLWLILAFIAALLVGWFISRGNKQARPTDALFSMAFTGLVVARIFFVLRYLPEYLDTPLSIIDIRDGGFDFIGGIVGIVIYTTVKLWRTPSLRRSFPIALLIGILVWGGTGGALMLMQPDDPRPDIQLETLAGDNTSLDAVAHDNPGKPMVINLWASWCPPCRAEMPMLEKAQKNNPDITFLFVNQGETSDTVEQFIQEESLDLDNMLLDDAQRLGNSVHARAFPTTLFYDASGQLVEQRMGMLSRATLQRSLQELQPQDGNSTSQDHED